MTEVRWRDPQPSAPHAGPLKREKEKTPSQLYDQSGLLVHSEGAAMLFVECPFCHQRVFRLWYSFHRARHTALLDDGQQTDHITLAEHERYLGSLDGVPQVYYHPLCGEATGMPEEIIRSYLANPFLYNDTTFCTGCNDYVPEAEVFWTETEQSLAEYKEQLQQAYLARHGRPP